MITFEGWPKTPRLSAERATTITEKIDGTNACVIIMQLDRWVLLNSGGSVGKFGGFEYVQPDEYASYGGYIVGAQSRKRLITPDEDNAGFARWVQENARALVQQLGPGRHFGEWWGQGIQRRYGMSHKVFSLFNTHRWKTAADVDHDLWRSIGLDVVPVLYQGRFSDQAVTDALNELRSSGSFASRRWGVEFNRPEGVIIRHRDLGGNLKAFVENDEVPKGAQ